ncbi:hypothetical protein GYB22_11485 [bacterium]|nr:hypothetical protein [bacterium]
MSADIDALVRLVEWPETSESTRKEAQTKLNIYGFKEEAIKASAQKFWSDYFEQQMDFILSEQPSLESYLLSNSEIQACFDVKFEEYRQRKKDLGIDDIRKYWIPF